MPAQLLRDIYCATYVRYELIKSN